MFALKLNKHKPEKKKKKDGSKAKTKKFKGTGLRIVDDQDSFGFSYKSGKRKNTNAGDSDEQGAEEMPTIAAVVDERPQEVQMLEEFGTGKWKKFESTPAESNFSLVSSSNNARHDSDDDLSPVRVRIRHDSDGVPSPPSVRRRHDSDDDPSPPRIKRKHDSEDMSPPRQRKRHDSDDLSPPRQRKRHDSDDLSPPRQRKRHDSDDLSPPRQRKRHDSDGDLSPPRQKQMRRKGSEEPSPPRRGRRHNLDDDPSPPRRNPRSSNRSSPVRNQRSTYKAEKDASPPRRSNHHKPHDSRRNVARPEILESGSKNDLPGTTLEGKKAGLQRASDLRNEMVDYRKRENEMFATLDDEVSGRTAKTKLRDKKTGRERDLVAELAKKEEEDKIAEEKKKQYDKWGKGLKQVEEQSSRLHEALHEVSKPMARYADDKDLDHFLKGQDREGDPMLQYLSSKKGKISDKPKYNGPPPPPNRFAIPPGYRWDGVDRSGGYEKEWFSRINAKKALQDEAYKWSVEDL